MIPRFIDWIWNVRGSLALPPGQSSDEAFDRLNPLFRQFGTSHERASDTLTFRKQDQAAQDKMSVFDAGILTVERGARGSVLRYKLTSRILLFCFLVPMLFLGMAQLTIVMNRLQPPPDAKAKAEKAAAKAKAAKQAAAPMNPIDKALGAPAPEKKKPDKKDDEDKPKPTAAYVFAAIFATLYVVGRILEDRLIRTVFRKRLLGT